MTNEDFTAIFERLKGILASHAGGLIVTADDANNYSLDSERVGPNKKPLFFGAVQIKKQYVSYHLMPLYLYPALLNEISPTLQKRMQGKSCFNFKKADDTAFDELERLTDTAYEQFMRA
jgi:hypothetical protein